MLRFSVEAVAAEETADAFSKARPRLIERYARIAEREAQRAVRGLQLKYRGGATTTPTRTRQGTGNLRASYGVQMNESQGGVDAAIGLLRSTAKGNALVYGHVHEEGAVIRSPSGKMLAIPSRFIRSPSGVAERRPREFPNAFFLPKPWGGILAEKRGEQVVPLFMLRRQVRVPARPPEGAINRTGKELEPVLQEKLADATVEVLNA